MPKVVRWFLKTALVYFAAALLLNLPLAAQAGDHSLPAGLRPVYIHLLVLGWISQLIMGVAIWMFPKYSQAQPRGREVLNWAVYGLLNAGLVLRAVAEPFNSTSPALAWKWLLVLSAVLQLAAGLLFSATAWQRVKEK